MEPRPSQDKRKYVNEQNYEKYNDEMKVKIQQWNEE